MKPSTKIIALAVAVLLAVPLAVVAAPPAKGGAPYEVKGSNFHIIGDHGNNMQYDGGLIFENEGSAIIEVDPVSNSGKIVTEWVDPRDSVASLVGKTAPVNVRIVATKFMPPDHPSGVLSDGRNTQTIDGDSIAINHFEHGSTGIGAPIVTNLFTHLATWGPVEVYIDGQFFGTLMLHTMLTAGVRDEATDQVLNADKTGFYSPMAPDDGFVDMEETQLHVIIRTGEPDSSNFPPFSIFWHLMFYDVKVEIRG
ncbi:MAG: hypothetical protein ACE5HJ_04240 [Thermoplasmata archaeon]